MSLMRSLLLAASQNVWLREHASHYKFVRRTVARFMPGEEIDDALAAAKLLEVKRIGSVFTHLGENIRDASEADEVAEHYLIVLERVRAAELQTEISVKLTQLGLDQSVDLCSANVKRILQSEDPAKTVWIDMEASAYVDATLEVYRRALVAFPRTGICLQAYLFRTKKDLEALLPLGPAGEGRIQGAAERRISREERRRRKLRCARRVHASRTTGRRHVSGCVWHARYGND